MGVEVYPTECAVIASPSQRSVRRASGSKTLASVASQSIGEVCLSVWGKERLIVS